MNKPLTLSDRFSLPPMPLKMTNREGLLTDAAVEWYQRVNAISLKNQHKDKENENGNE
jgi:2,4-dienoyl-CoA reductase-like NADH-dependent reductase (Old Yellow Enzyme family)